MYNTNKKQLVNELVLQDDECEIEYSMEIDGKIESNSFSMPSIDNSFVYSQLEKINDKIEYLTSNTDNVDILISACSGIICAAIDSILKEGRIRQTFGGEIEGKDILDFFNESGAKQVNEKIEKIASSEKTAKRAKKSIEKGATTLKEGASKIESNKLSDMVEFLEKRFNIPSDAFEQYYGGTTKHHLNDFAHHPSIVGLVFSLLTQLTCKCYGTDNKGTFKVVPIKFEEGHKGRIGRINSGEKIYVKIIGDNLQEKLFFGVTVWYYHLISDLAGSSGTLKGYEKRNMSSIGKGAGVPGPLMSLAKALSVLPIFSRVDDNGETENKFAEFIDKLYSGDIFKKIDENGSVHKRKFDYRTETGIKKELTEQSKMVIVNEMIVRSFYFIRRLAFEIKEKNIKRIEDLNLIDKSKVIPFGNRSIVRMITVATGSFTTTNLAIGASVSIIESGGEPATFVKNFVMRINFVGVGRFFVAVGTDITEGAIRNKLINDTSVYKAHQETLKYNVEKQRIAVMNDFANSLTGADEQGINDFIKILGEQNEKE